MPTGAVGNILRSIDHCVNRIGPSHCPFEGVNHRRPQEGREGEMCRIVEVLSAKEEDVMTCESGTNHFASGGGRGTPKIDAIDLSPDQSSDGTKR